MISVIRATLAQLEVEVNVMGAAPGDLLRAAGREVIKARVVGVDGRVSFFSIALTVPDGATPRVFIRALNPEAEVTRHVNLIPWPPESIDEA